MLALQMLSKNLNLAWDASLPEDARTLILWGCDSVLHSGFSLLDWSGLGFQMHLCLHHKLTRHWWLIKHNRKKGPSFVALDRGAVFSTIINTFKTHCFSLLFCFCLIHMWHDSVLGLELCVCGTQVSINWVAVRNPPHKKRTREKKYWNVYVFY